MPRVAATLGKNIPYPPGDSVTRVHSGPRPQRRPDAGAGRAVVPHERRAVRMVGLLAPGERQRGDSSRCRPRNRDSRAGADVAGGGEHDGGGVVTLDEQVAAAARNGEPGPIRQAYIANCAARSHSGGRHK